MESEFFEWDDDKAAGNLEKHDVAFEVVFELDWNRAIIRPDDRGDYGEHRWRAFHLLENELRLVVVFTRRNDRFRITSIRRAHAKEQRKWIR